MTNSNWDIYLCSQFSISEVPPAFLEQNPTYWNILLIGPLSPSDTGPTKLAVDSSLVCDVPLETTEYCYFQKSG